MNQAPAKGSLEESIRIANASGGILGFGNKISDEEQAVIERIANGLGKSGNTTES